MIKIFTDISVLSEYNRRSVFPLLFDLHYLKNELLEIYELTEDLENSDIAVLPLQLNVFSKGMQNDYVKKFVLEAKKGGKKTWIYTAGDYGITIKDSSIFNFRLGGFHSKLNSNTFVMPSFISDPLLVLGLDTVEVKPKEITPIIGFVGNADGSYLKQIKEFANYTFKEIIKILGRDLSDTVSFYPSAKRRFQLLKILRKENKIQSNFILRNKYRAGVTTDFDRKKTVEDYFENMNSSNYILCLRGVGNFSVRFYETLAMGRIPVLIDTDSRLPLENTINWSKHCVLIPEGNAPNITSILSEWHAKIGKDTFEELQKNNRQLWENSLKREAYFKEIYKQFQEVKI